MGASKKSALKGHVEFFDKDLDGVIWPWNTYTGLRELGFNMLLAIFSVIVIHGGFSYVTWPSWIPDPFFRIQAKHGSDTESYTVQGDFDAERFNYNFNLYTDEPHTHLTFRQGVKMIYGNRNPFDLFGWFAAFFELCATYVLLWPTDPKGMSKADIVGVYDGSIFYEIAKRKEKPH